MKVVSVSSLKGGVGKTCLALFMGQELAAQGRRVLLVDADANNNLTDYLFRDEAELDQIEARNLYHVLKGAASLGDCIRPRSFKIGRESFGLDALPCTPELARATIEFSSNPGSVLRFRKQLRELPYDLILCDTGPSFSFELRAILHAADLVLCPVRPDRWTLQGFDIIGWEVRTVGEGLDKAPRLLAVPSIVTESQELALRASRAGKFLSKTAIRKSAAIDTAATKGKPLTAQKARAQYLALARELSR